MTPNPIAQEAFAQHRRRVESVAARIVRDPEEAADIASEVFLALLERGPANEDAVVPWLVTSARNRALNRVRDKARAVRNLRRIEPAEQVDPIPDDDRIPALVRETLARLSERDRLALTMRYGAEARSAAIAERLGVSEAQARVVLHRAVQRMRSQAISILAERHGAPASCRSALTDAVSRAGGARHAGCAPCSTVMDEVAALGAPAVFAAPMMPLVERIVSHVSSLAHRVRAPRMHGLDRAGEMVAAIVLATSLGAGQMPVEPVTPMGEEARPARAVALNDISKHARDATAKVDVPVRSRRVGELLSVDDHEEERPLTPSKVTLLGKTLAVPDAVSTGPSDPALDIRRFELGTTADAAGRPSGLLATVLLGAQPLHNEFIDVSWYFMEGTGCNAAIRADHVGAKKPTLRFTAFCARSLIRGDRLDESEALSMKIDGSAVAFVIDFEKLSSRMKDLLRPGARLEDVAVGTSGGDSLFNTGDHAPDRGQADYRVQKSR